ncbi:MAG: helix-turn-helix domain-containing protein [Halioglobus sp.]
MKGHHLEELGHRVAQLRYRQQLKQSELARDSGISLRTLQRLEAGDIVKTDALLRVLQCLGRLDALLGTLAPAELSPYEQLAQAGLKPADLGKRKAVSVFRRAAATQGDASGQGVQKRRVRRPVSKMLRQGASPVEATKIPAFQWPEDQAS